MNTNPLLDDRLRYYYRYLRHQDYQEIPPVFLHRNLRERPQCYLRLLSFLLYFSLGAAACTIVSLTWKLDRDLTASDFLQQITDTSYDNYPADIFYPQWTDYTSADIVTDILLQPFTQDLNQQQPN